MKQSILLFLALIASITSLTTYSSVYEIHNYTDKKIKVFIKGLLNIGAFGTKTGVLNPGETRTAESLHCSDTVTIDLLDSNGKSIAQKTINWDTIDKWNRCGAAEITVRSYNNNLDVDIKYEPATKTLEKAGKKFIGIPL